MGAHIMTHSFTLCNSPIVLVDRPPFFLLDQLKLDVDVTISSIST
ncbi:hypothetical protein LINGRAHAP2_LOCUS5241 [Linum grandiflorum]